MRLFLLLFLVASVPCMSQTTNPTTLPSVDYKKFPTIRELKGMTVNQAEKLLEKYPGTKYAVVLDHVDDETEYYKTWLDIGEKSADYEITVTKSHVSNVSFKIKE